MEVPGESLVLEIKPYLDSQELEFVGAVLGGSGAGRWDRRRFGR